MQHKRNKKIRSLCHQLQPVKIWIQIRLQSVKLRNQVRLMMICAQINVPAVVRRVGVAQVMKMKVATEARVEVGVEGIEKTEVKVERDGLAALIMIDI